MINNDGLNARRRYDRKKPAFGVRLPNELIDRIKSHREQNNWTWETLFQNAMDALENKTTTRPTHETLESMTLDLLRLMKTTDPNDPVQRNAIYEKLETLQMARDHWEERMHLLSKQIAESFGMNPAEIEEIAMMAEHDRQ